jgi:cell division protein FtsB
MSRRSRRPDDSDDSLDARPRRRLLGLVWVTVVVGVTGGLVLLLVVPTRAWLEQRSEARETQERLAALQAANDALEARVAALQTPEEIERVAREQYNLSRPGEQIYSVLPEGLPDGLPSGWPFALVGEIITARTQPVAPPTTAPAG